MNNLGMFYRELSDKIGKLVENSKSCVIVFDYTDVYRCNLIYGGIKDECTTFG